MGKYSILKVSLSRNMSRTCPKILELYQVTIFEMSYQKNTIEEVDLTKSIFLPEAKVGLWFNININHKKNVCLKKVVSAMG